MTFTTHRRRSCLCSIAAVLFQLPAILVAQPPSAPTTPAFTSLTIRRVRDSRHLHFSFDGQHFNATNIGLSQLIALAYGQPARITGLPDWATSARYEIDAVAPNIPSGVPLAPPGRLAGQPMLQTLLQDRFQLAAHAVQQPTPAFALVLAAGAPKLRLAAANPHGRPGIEDGPRTGILEGNAATMAMLAASLTRYAASGSSVLDQTGLSERYNFTLHWNAIESTSASPVNVTNSDKINPELGTSFGQQCERGQIGCVLDSNVPGLRTALREELGLDLRPIPSPSNTLIIDHIEKPKLN